MQRRDRRSAPLAAFAALPPRAGGRLAASGPRTPRRRAEPASGRHTPAGATHPREAHPRETSLGEGGFVVPCVLLLLQAGPREADELCELVAAFGFARRARVLPSLLDRLEADALIEQARRTDAGLQYALTSRGQGWLQARWEVLAEPARLVARFLACYAAATAAAPTADRPAGQAGADDASAGDPSRGGAR